MDWHTQNKEDADLAFSATTWAESYTAQTVTSTVATDEAVANSTRLQDAMVDHAGKILVAWTLMTDGLATQMAAAAASVNASLASIKDKTVTITTVYRTIRQGGGGGGWRRWSRTRRWRGPDRHQQQGFAVAQGSHYGGRRGCLPGSPEARRRLTQAKGRKSQ